MKHLRTKLFLSVGIIFLFLALLHYLVPEMIIRRQLDKTAVLLNAHIESVQQKIRRFSSFLVTLNMVESVAELDGVSTMLASGPSPVLSTEKSDWTLGAQIAAFDPKISFVKVGASSVIVPEETPLYVPLYARLSDTILWIKLTDTSNVLAAIKTKDTSYLLFDRAALDIPSSDPALQNNLSYAKEHFSESQTTSFTSFQAEATSLSMDDSVQTLYTALLEQENQWVSKAHLIEQLAPWEAKKNGPIPVGILETNATLNRGVCLLGADVFQTSPTFQSFIPPNNADLPFFILRQTKNGQDLTMLKRLKLSGERNTDIELGFSISSIVRRLARILQKTVLLNQPGEFSLGFSPEGKDVDPSTFPFDRIKVDRTPVSWEEKEYVPFQIDLNVLKVVILTPESEASALSRFLEKTRHIMSQQISINLLATTALSLFIALLLLNGISKKITEPIAELSTAAEHLGKGKYDAIALPKLGHRQDEVAILTHSFENMVIALRDRDKVRSVLNKVVSKEISAEILKGNIELGGEERIITMLFTDIRGFTHLSAHLDPKALIEILNAYMTRMCHIIDATHGVVDKFVGDEIVALYGAPTQLPSHAVQAIEASLLMLEDLRTWNEQCKKEGKVCFEIGVGIHTGNVCLGNMGAENRLNYTVIGSNVNLTARLCSQARPMQIIVSEQTWKAPGVQEKFRFQSLPPLTLKGIDEPVPAYEVLGRT